MLEYAIRPYTSPNAQGKILIPSTPQSNLEHPILTWGAQSQLPPPVPGQVQVACCNETSKQVDKKGETVRITGTDPGDDSPSYIDVFRANELTLNNKMGGGSDGGISSGGGGGGCDNSPLFDFSSDVEAGVDAVLNEFNNAIAGAAGGQCQQKLTLDNNTHSA